MAAGSYTKLPAVLIGVAACWSLLQGWQQMCWSPLYVFEVHIYVSLADLVPDAIGPCMHPLYVYIASRDCRYCKSLASPSLSASTCLQALYCIKCANV